MLRQPRREPARAQHRAVQLDAGLRRRLRRLHGARVHGQEPVPKARVADFQALQEHRQRLPVVRLPGQLQRPARQLHVEDHLREPPVELHGLQVVAEVLPGLALDLVDPLHQLGERTELVDPLRGGLLAHPRNARQVVRRVAAQRREVRVLLRCEPVLLHHLLRRVARQLRDALRRIQHRDIVGDQLEGVTVARDDRHLEPLRRRLLRQRRDDVVGLEALHREPLRAHRVEHLADQLDLPLELVRGLRAVRLVLGELLRAPRLARHVEGHREMRRRLITQRVRQHRREAVHRVRRLARRGREILHGQREERPVRHGVPVHQEQAGAASPRCLGAGRCARLRCLCCHVPDPATTH